jgi:outer membrane protein assembly factor BamE
MNRLFIILTTLLLTACFQPYNPDIKQGNILNIAHVEQVEVGMSQEQVRDLLGSPSIIDVFHKNRWDYINRSYLPSSKNINFHLSLEFDKNKILTKIDRKNISLTE